MGTSADMMINPWGALLIGSAAAVLSVVGFQYITVRILKISKVKIYSPLLLKGIFFKYASS